MTGAADASNVAPAAVPPSQPVGAVPNTPTVDPYRDPANAQYELYQLMQKSAVSEPVIRWYLQGRKRPLISISDFAAVYTQSNHEDKTEKEVFKVTGYEDDDLEVARVRIAWNWARSEFDKALKKNSEEASSSSAVDLDLPLSKDEERERANSFKQAYPDIRFEAEDMPVRFLVGRTFRELNSETRELSAIDLRKMRTEAEYLEFSKKPPKKNKLGGGFSLVKEDDKTVELPDITITNLTLVLAALRILMHLLVYCGAKLVPSKTEIEASNQQPKKVRQFPFSTGIRYYGFVQGQVLQHPGSAQQKIEWVLDRHRRTYNNARSLYRQGHPLGEALMKAVFGADCQIDWRLTGVGINTRTPSHVERKRLGDDEDDDEESTGKRQKAMKAMKAMKAPAPVGKSLAAKRNARQKSRACPDYNAGKCVFKQQKCPLKKLHCCSKCGKFGHRASECNE